MTDFLAKLTASIEPLIGADSLPSEAAAPRPPLEERARLRVDRREILRQQNIERIVELAVAEMPVEVCEGQVPNDWLIQFFDVAQDVCDDRAQPIWARLLALGIADPDAIFRRTLTHLKNMDQWELEAFVEYCGFSFLLESGWRFIFEDEFTRQQIWGYVRGNDYTQHFINIGLLSPETALIRPTSSKGLRIRYFDQEYELASSSNAEAAHTQDACIGYRKFTPVGQQIGMAIRSRAFYGYARNIIKALGSERHIPFTLIERPTVT
jgi:hypothetical protein